MEVTCGAYRYIAREATYRNQAAAHMEDQVDSTRTWLQQVRRLYKDNYMEKSTRGSWVAIPVAELVS